MQGKLEVISKINCIVGESPVWDEKTNTLYFVDIRGKCFYTVKNFGETPIKTEVLQQIGCIALCENGDLLLGMEDGIYRREKSGKITLAHSPVKIKGRRFNDGKCAPDGFYYAGTTSDTGDGAFYRLMNGNLTELFGKCICSNGIDFSLDKKTMYYCDSGLHKVEAFDFSEESHFVQNRRILTPIPEETGLGDGMCIDADDNLWVAVWGGGKILHIDSKSGKIIGEILLPVSKPSACVFGGENLDELIITSASFGVDLEKEPMAGYTFKIKCGFKGRKLYRCKN